MEKRYKGNLWSHFCHFYTYFAQKKNFRQNLTYSTFNYPLSILITEFSFKSEKRTEQIENEQKMNRFWENVKRFILGLIWPILPNFSGTKIFWKNKTPLSPSPFTIALTHGTKFQRKLMNVTEKNFSQRIGRTNNHDFLANKYMLKINNRNNRKNCET